MQGSGKRSTMLAVAVFALWGIPALASHQAAASDAPAREKMTVEGPILVTHAGMSLYLNSAENTQSPKFAWQCTEAKPNATNDSQSGIGERPEIGFKFIKSCLDKFPPYVADASAMPVGDFTIATRPDGTRQWAYKGFPLYTSIKDHGPGELNSASRNFGGRRLGMTTAIVATTLPANLKLTRRAEGLVLVTADNERPVYTPREGGRLIRASIGREDFKPIAAPAIARVGGEWSIIDGGAGQKQYAFRGKPLYAAPASLNELEIAGARGWEPIVVVKAPEAPTAIGRHLTLMGDVYTDKKGMSLYTYNCNANGGTGTLIKRVTGVACDDAGDPAAFMVALCGDGKECARRWHPYIAAPGAKPEGEFSIVDITYPMFTDMRGKLYPSDAPRVKAWAYRGKPLFTYYEDEKPGDMWGNNIGGIWGSTWTIAAVPGRGATYFEP